MDNLTVILPESLKPLIETSVAEGGYASIADYLRALVEEDHRRKEELHLEKLLLEGLNSGEGRLVTEEFWEERRRRILERYGNGNEPTP
ncbi:ribbon-helix-helix domain-containing protein [Tundrisphaera sp. TA3]|uniref:ribbon-helix-helix domain-containing protein n=1 Tax=Tundrisphaera sp. TA3 TaxID=3435775 RepID=UPI003EBAD558